MKVESWKGKEERKVFNIPKATINLNRYDLKMILSIIYDYEYNEEVEAISFYWDVVIISENIFGVVIMLKCLPAVY